MPEKRIHAGLLLQWAVRNFPDKLAAVCKGRSLAFRQLDEAANRLANALLGCGLRTGDRVAVMLHNSLETLITTQAIERAGLAFVRLHPPESLEVRDYILHHSEARVMLMDARFVAEWKQSEFGRDASRIEIAIPATDFPGNVPGVLSFDRLCAAASPDDPNVMVGAGDIRAIGYTSGTTGRPKGITYTFGAWMNRLRNDFFNQDIIIDDRDVLLSAAPLTHAAGVVALPYLIKGATNIILEKFDAEEMLATIERERVTAFFVVPTMMTRLVNHPKARDYDYSSLRRIYYASAPMSVEVLRKAIDIFGARVLRQHYAVGEHPQPVTLLYPSDHDVADDPIKQERLGSVGRLCIGSELKLMNEDGHEAGAGEAGEIWIRGDAGMSGYWKDPELTAETMVDGWIRTGDVGRMDAGGYLFLVDRMKDMLISGGFNIYPREIERVIESHPSVLEVCVFGVPDDEWGEAVKAVVVLKQGARATTEELMDYCRSHLSGHKKPKTIDFVGELPKSATGKLLRRALREPYWQGRERKI